ncbi:hypothetical protein [Subtercola endophyticus]|uniref:hypothetical protein n=1 Tax=Subtercola endophyticus TaxID=2895559 RepID=UPI001E389C96|nr:hypothetical protein [Subtercola endophyticus]UFS57490.1 hypothetical protein LQ955_10485 [Subtercola endophyticus]
MRELHYGSGVITVSFDVCSAVFDYTVALANAGKTDRITVPVITDGERGFSNLLLGPQTQLYCTAVAGETRGTGVDNADNDSADDVDLEDRELVETLKKKTAALVPGSPLSAANRRLNSDSNDLD